ncbi:hypothetical protein QTJ16_005715 [Diplocarpon rosae]|uniref:Uncharacterized protein n=1 Tax=Diplocarpon rosae TaxID=946125 RepID=A0AAD9SXH1_9HELO|nr:hypothetical protein QTJ16_005715 [Diplocarpon rosae]
MRLDCDMSMMKSPASTALSPNPHIRSHKSQGLSSLISKERKRGFQNVDDTSSSASTSTSKSTPGSPKCWQCKSKASLTNRLVFCVNCGKGVCEGCSRVRDPKLDFTCRRCVTKSQEQDSHRSSRQTSRETSQQASQQISEIISTAISSAVLPEASQELKMPKICGYPNCRSIVTYSRDPNASMLCFAHTKAAQNRSAAALPPAPKLPEPRIINKNKLHHLRPEERPLVKKRKRVASERKIGVGSYFDRTKNVSRPLQRSRSSGTGLQSHEFGKKDRATMQNLSLPQILIPQSTQNETGTQPKTLLRDKPPQSTMQSQKIEENRSRPHSQPVDSLDCAASRFTDNKKLPPTSVSTIDPYVTTNQSQNGDDNLTSQINQEIKGTAKGSNDLEMPTANLLRILSLIGGRKQGAPSVKSGIYRESTAHILQGSENLSTADKLPSKINLSHSIPPSPITESSSTRPLSVLNQSSMVFDPPSQSSHSPQDKNEKAIDLFKEPSVEKRLENSAIAYGRRKARIFDESILDFYLKRHAERGPLYEPTPREILDTQTWAALDPRTIYPIRQTSIQREQRMAEIAARPRRKANFGKHLLPHVVKERREKGWDVHQSCEKKTDDESLEFAQKMDELCGGAVSNCEPKIVNGRLVMHEKEREPEPKRPGRQKKEQPLLVLPVGL